jgi:hypothetical protein
MALGILFLGYPRFGQQTSGQQTKKEESKTLSIPAAAKSTGSL